MKDVNVFRKVFPVGITLAPIGILFGLLAAQEKWNVFDVFLMSLIGFTGSGQFAYLSFYSQGLESIGYLTVFLVVLSINLRYIPMTFSATSHLNTSKLNKIWISHYLSDESYAVEMLSEKNNIKNKIYIRLIILCFWVFSTSIGVLFANYIPNSTSILLQGLTFPISSILILLSLTNILEYYKNNRNTKNILFATVVAVFIFMLLGEKFFWIPSILICYYILVYLNKE